jgi:ComEC/Rec2-related protein
LVLFPKAPAYRAFVSVALFLTASLLERRYDALKALVLAYTVSLLFFPHWFFNFGFWLSYLASLSLVLYYGGRRTPEESFFSSFLGKFLGLEATLVVLATISPVLVYSLKYLSLGSFLYGFLFTALAELFLLVGTFNLLTLWVFEPTVKLQEWVSNLFGFALQKLPTEGLCLYFNQPPLWLTVLTVLLPLAVLLSNLSKGKKIAALTAVFAGEIVLFKAL